MKESDKVVCVNANFGPDAYSIYDTLPELDRIYVIRSVLPWRGKLGIRLVGIHGTIHPNGLEFAFFSSRFRKLDEIKAENAALQCAHS